MPSGPRCALHFAFYLRFERASMIETMEIPWTNRPSSTGVGSSRALPPALVTLDAVVLSGLNSNRKPLLVSSESKRSYSSFMGRTRIIGRCAFSQDCARGWPPESVLWCSPAELAKHVRSVRASSLHPTVRHSPHGRDKTQGCGCYLSIHTVRPRRM